MCNFPTCEVLRNYRVTVVNQSAIFLVHQIKCDAPLIIHGPRFLNGPIVSNKKGVYRSQKLLNPKYNTRRHVTRARARGEKGVSLEKNIAGKGDAVVSEIQLCPLCV